MNKKALYDLSDSGFKVAYLPQFETYLIVTAFKTYNPSNHIHENNLTGKDITELITNIAIFTDKLTLANYIEGLKVRTFVFDKDLKFIWLT